MRCPASAPRLLASPLLAAALAFSLWPAPLGAESARPAREMKFDRSFGRENAAMKEALLPLAAPLARSTVHILVDGKNTVLGTAVHQNGWLLTKSSEVPDAARVQVEFPHGLRLPAQVSDRLDAYDLALLKIDASGLTPVTWSDQPPPEPGSFLAAVSPEGQALAIGVASVGPRSLYETPRGFLGVRLEDQGAVIERVYEGGAAEKAGLQASDTITAVQGVAITDRQSLIREVSSHRPGAGITLDIVRGEENLKIQITLMDRAEFVRNSIEREDPMVLMSGPLSQHRHGFFNVFQHDLILAPGECGGPLIDLEGRVAGLNIARSGRVESLAIPAADLRDLLAKVETGRFALPDVNALRDDLQKADLAIMAAQEARRSAELTLRRARELIDTLPPPPAAPLSASPPSPPSAPAAQP